jgi:hypothetical protein
MRRFWLRRLKGVFFGWQAAIEKVNEPLASAAWV